MQSDWLVQTDGTDDSIGLDRKVRIFSHLYRKYFTALSYRTRSKSACRRQRNEHKLVDILIVFPFFSSSCLYSRARESCWSNRDCNDEKKNVCVPNDWDYTAFIYWFGPISRYRGTLKYNVSSVLSVSSSDQCFTFLITVFHQSINR
jgi:hypothetical protein